VGKWALERFQQLLRDLGCLPAHVSVLLLMPSVGGSGARVEVVVTVEALS